MKQLAVRSWKRVAAVCAVILAMAVAGWAQGVNRITQELGTGGVVRLPGSVHRLVSRSTDLGEVNPAMQLGSMTMHFGLSAEQQIDLDALTAAQQDSKSPQYHQWLTQEQYGARFGLSDADLARVTHWLQSQGFTVHGVSKSRNALYFGGAASQVESAFHTHLHRYVHNGEQHFANATDLQIPAQLRGVLLVVRGLTDFRPKPQLKSAQAVADFTLSSSQHYLAPGDWSTIYNVGAIYNAGYTGTGAYVGVVGQTYVTKSDIDNFRSAAGLGATQLTFVCIDSTTSQCTGVGSVSTAGDQAEADLDIEWAGGIAKNATVVYVYAPYSVVGTTIDPVTSQFYDVFDALDHAVNDYTVPATGKVLPVISMSYTDCEGSFNGQPGYVTWITQMGQQANTQGQTIVVATGDTGAAGCDLQTDYPASQGLSATVPVDSPNYTGVGGTVLSGDEASPSTYWNQTVNQVNTALSYIPNEAVWNDTTADSRLSTTGGGVSLYFSQPTWQPTPTNYTGSPGRFIPDVAFTASADHDGYIFCSSDYNSTTYGTMCANGFYSSGGTSGTQVFYPVGGTSAAAPSFAGMLTLLEQRYGPQGNLNPTLYQMAANSTTYAQVFHDITTGNNIVPCVSLVANPTDTGCVGGSSTTNGTMGYSATTGYDMTTGLGSIDGGALYTALAALSGPAATTTSASAQPNPDALNATVTLTANVSSTTAGTITGSVDFHTPAMDLGSAQISGGLATLSGVAVTAANGLGEGTDLVTASYAGDGTFAASDGSATITVYDPTAPPPLVSLSQSSATAGGTSFTLTVNGANFPTNATVLWNGAVRATTRVNSTQLTATILAADIAKEGTALITVSNAAPSAQTSAALPFAVMSATPVARITGGTLTVASDGSGNHVLTLTGTNFVSSSVATWNSIGLTTSVVSPWQLAAIVTGSEFSTRPGVVNTSGTSVSFTLP